MTGPFGRDDVQKIAGLAKLRLTDAEAERFAGQFAAILGHLEKLRAVDTEGVAPLDHPLPLTDVLRDDVAVRGLSRYEALCRAPDMTSDSFRVPKVGGDIEG
ncbi:MAG: Asp-tRNA(Asn)/Glu-tRNA(Gln) amidotransferase subunit GatC [Planctomycetes bacterium]|nr:Asp-tRNA(Asn)/Glu-tRNA(Gln) amidotransferase subunit GatC [Planctomycetota bacterium]